MIHPADVPITTGLRGMRYVARLPCGNDRADMLNKKPTLIDARTG